MPEISENTQAILLLTAPLIVSRKAEPAKILTLKEYNILARCLHSGQFQPQDLLNQRRADILPKLPASFDQTRLDVLLNRGFLLGQALTEWQRRSIWVVSRADSSYPKRLRSKLREQAPAVLYGWGERALLEKGGLAVVGSRKISEELNGYTEQLGALAAAARVPIISGAARGIDRAAMAGALTHGGIVIGVMADGLGAAAVAKSNREAFREGRLVLISAYDPAAGFNVGHAMQRNKAIYALADAGLVVTSDFNKGGTWAGAVEQLEKYRYGPVFVKNGADCGEGNAALLQRGGKRWPEPRVAHELFETIRNAVYDDLKTVRVEQLGLPQANEEAAESPGTKKPESGQDTPTAAAGTVDAATRLPGAVSGDTGGGSERAEDRRRVGRNA